MFCVVGYSYCLSEEYCRLHFLSGLLLKNLCTAIYEDAHVRNIAINIFRNLLVKHSLDDR